KIGSPLSEQERKARAAEGEVYAKSHHVIDKAESIAFLKGTHYEFNAINATVKVKRIYHESVAKIRLTLHFITSFHFDIQFFIPLLLSVPNIIAKKMSTSTMFEIMPSFSWVVQLFTWRNENYHLLTSSEVSLARMEKFSTLLNDWETQANRYVDKH